MFMHNGAVGRFLRVKRKLGQKLSKEVYYAIDGTTDTEHIFALLLDLLGSERDNPDVSLDKITDAFIRTIQIIVKMVYSVEELHEPHVYSSLNFALTNGKIVIASRFRDGPEDPPSLYVHDRGSYECDVNGTVQVPLVSPSLTTADVIIASEPLTAVSEDWQLVPKDSVVICNEANQLEFISLLSLEVKESDSFWWN